MATIIKIKRTTGATAPSGLNQGELAYVYDTGSSSTGAGGSGLRLYIGDPTSTSNSAIQIGGLPFFTFQVSSVTTSSTVKWIGNLELTVVS